jgi:methylmalonyl-CoA mutase N-terminal domain/subunit
MLEKFKSQDLTPYSTTEIAEILAAAINVSTVYKTRGVQPPAWVEALTSGAEAVFKTRVRDELLAKREQVKRQLAGLATPEERRAAAEAELKALDAQLGG